MPEQIKSAMELLWDIDLASPKVNPQHLDSLIQNLEKSEISSAPVSVLRRSKITIAPNSRYEELVNINRRKEVTPEKNVPEFEVEKTDKQLFDFSTEKVFSLNRAFTVPEKILGPFTTIDGGKIFYNFYRYIDDFKVLFPGEAQAAFIIPARFQRIILGNTNVSKITLSKGNVWIRADIMDPAAPKNRYIGLRISSGTLDLGGTFPLGSNSVQIPKNSAVLLDISLDNSYQAENSQIGIDGKHSVFVPTDKLTLKSRNGRLQSEYTNMLYGKTMGWENNFRAAGNIFMWDAAKEYMRILLTPEKTVFAVHKSESELYELKGRCPVSKAFWVLPSRILQQNKSVEVKINGALSMNLLAGLEAKWDGIRDSETSVHIAKAEVMFYNGFFLLGSENSDFGYLHDCLTMWQKSAENPAKMEADVKFANYKTFNILSQCDLGDGVTAFADTEFFIDNPIRADNTPLHPKTKKSIYGKSHTKDYKSIILFDNDLLTENNGENISEFSPKTERYQFALENAYFTTSKETGLYLNAKYDERNFLYEGSLLLNFYIYHLLPTLPHPYTSNKNILKRGEKLAVSGVLLSTISWKTEDELTLADVTFKMNHSFSDNDAEESQYMNMTYVPKERIPLGNMTKNSFMLFDVSTQSDYWGIALSFQNREMMRKMYYNDITVSSENVVTINRNYLQAPVGFLNALTLPQVSWEPVNNISASPNSVDPPVEILNQANNSIPTVFNQLGNQQIKIHPKNYMKMFRMNLKSENAAENLQSKILFTLPNGKVSIVSLNPYKNETMYNENHLDFIMPEFEYQKQEIRGGIQFRIAAYKAPNPQFPPEMKGITMQFPVIENHPGISILGKTVTDIFNNTFAHEAKETDTGVPLTHIDFSGYGASTFSKWKNPLMKFASISQAKFDILKGRTAHELVEAVSMIYPWGICATRTITFLRNNNAVIFREDSGWMAQSEGLFDFSFVWPEKNPPNTSYNNPYNIYPGLVQGLFNIRNIREDYSDVQTITYYTEPGDYYLDTSGSTKTVKTNTSGIKVKAAFVAVYFDADVQLDALDKKITGKQFKGYLQVMPEGVPIPARVLKELLSKSQNAVSGNINTILSVEKTLQKFKANAVEMVASYQNDDIGNITFVASVKGSPVLPSEGSWSVVEVDNASGNVQNLTPGTSTGLVKDGIRPKNNGLPFTLASNKTMLAFPDALKNTTDAFAKTYGFLQNTDTQKLLLKSMEYTKGQVDKYTSDPALLADCFRLMNSKGPFPNLKDGIKIDDAAKTVMNMLPDSVQKTFNYKVPDNFNFDIIGKPGDAFRIYLKYTSIDKDGQSTDKSVIDYVTDPKSIQKWANKMHNITIAVDLAVFKPIMYISGNFGNGKTASPSLEGGTGPQLKLDKTLQTIYDILEFLNNLDPTQPSEALKKGLKIAMSNSADSWEYKFKAEKEIPLVKFPFDPINYNSPTTPLKMDAFFKMGVYFNQPIKIPETIDQIKPSVGAFLQLGADIRVMCVSLGAATIYAMGRAEVGLAADLNSPPTLHFKFGFGVELSVGLPVIGSVAVTYMVGIDMTLNTQELIVGAFIYFRGRAEIFGGIVTITIAIEAAGKIQKKIGNGPTNCVAMCTFALDISIAFVININFTETWQETRQIS